MKLMEEKIQDALIEILKEQFVLKRKDPLGLYMVVKKGKDIM